MKGIHAYFSSQREDIPSTSSANASLDDVSGSQRTFVSQSDSGMHVSGSILVNSVGGGENVAGKNVVGTDVTTNNKEERKSRKIKSGDWDADRKFKINWKDKKPCLLQLKLDMIEKHMGKMYVKKNIDGKEVSVIEWNENCKHKRYVNGYQQHLKDEEMRSRAPSIPNMWQKMLDRNLTEKLVQFQTVYHILQLGRSMTDYEKHKQFVKLQGNPNFLHSHWSRTSAWEFAKAINEVIKQDLNEIVKNCDYFAISLDEGSSKGNITWICMTIYHVKGHTRHTEFAGIIELKNDATVENVFEIVKETLLTTFQLTPTEIATKIVCVGVDGASAMQGSRTGLCVRIQTAFMIGIHCMAHRVNLAFQIVDDFVCIQKVETMVSDAYAFFRCSPKRLKKFKEMVVGLTKGNRMLKNVATRWISLSSPAKWLFNEYEVLVALVDKLASTRKEGEKALQLLEELTDVETLLTLAGLLPMLREMSILSKLAQSRTLYISKYSRVRKLVCIALDCLYTCTSSMPYNKDKFPAWYKLIHIEGENSTSFLTYNSRGFLCVKAHSKLVKMYMTKPRRRGCLPCRVGVKRDDFEAIIPKVRKNLAEVAQALAKQIREHFPNNDLLEAMTIVYPQFWMNSQRIEKVQSEFKCKLHILLAHFAYSTPFNGIQIHGILDEEKLLAQSQTFGTTMWSHAGQFIDKEITKFGCITNLWNLLGYDQVLREHMSEYFKLIDLCQTMILGSVEDERTFSIMGVLKNKVRNKLTKNLDLCLRAYGCKYDIEEFPYERALAIWSSQKERRGCEEEVTMLEPPKSLGWKA